MDLCNGSARKKPSQSYIVRGESGFSDKTQFMCARVLFAILLSYVLKLATFSSCAINLDRYPTVHGTIILFKYYLPILYIAKVQKPRSNTVHGGHH